MKVHFNPASDNSKTGRMPVTTSSKKNCWEGCPFKNDGCYAELGPLKIHWDLVTEGKRGLDWGKFIAKIDALPLSQLWRHNQAGELEGIGSKIDAKKLDDLVKANNGKRGFTYTHKPLTSANKALIADANARGFTINVSANNLRHADRLKALAIAPVCVVVPEDQTKNMRTPAGNKVVICPATQREGVTCLTCQLCQNKDRGMIIGFPAHGTRKRKVSELVKN